MKQPVRVAVTGAAGAISYTILFKIAAGELLGKDQPVILQLVEIPPAMDCTEWCCHGIDRLCFSVGGWDYQRMITPRQVFKMRMSFS